MTALSAVAFDVVLLDLSLPDSSGLDTLAVIQADAHCPAITCRSRLISSRMLILSGIPNVSQPFLCCCNSARALSIVVFEFGSSVRKLVF